MENTKCPFCDIDYTDISNTIIEETDNFLIVPTKGALVVGYLLVVPKQHVTSMNELKDFQKQELLNIIKKYREKFYAIFGKHPIVFEHGTSRNDSKNSASSITHAHYHIVNHNFKNESKIINQLKLRNVDEISFYKNNEKSYISYISSDFKFYITYNFEGKSQQMRIFIAEDLSIENEYNWKISNFENNIIETVRLFKKQ